MIEFSVTANFAHITESFVSSYRYRYRYSLFLSIDASERIYAFSSISPLIHRRNNRTCIHHVQVHACSLLIDNTAPGTCWSVTPIKFNWGHEWKLELPLGILFECVMITRHSPSCKRLLVSSRLCAYFWWAKQNHSGHCLAIRNRLAAGIGTFHLCNTSRATSYPMDTGGSFPR